MKRKTKERIKAVLSIATFLAVLAAGTVAFGQEPKNPYTKLITEASEDELHEMEQILYLECRGEPFEGQVACAQVILNRVMHDGYGDTIHEVLSEKLGGYRQFVTWPYREEAKPGEDQSDVIEYICNCKPEELPLEYTDCVYFDTKGRNGVDKVKIGGHYFGRCKGRDGVKICTEK